MMLNAKKYNHYRLYISNKMFWKQNKSNNKKIPLLLTPPPQPPPQSQHTNLNTIKYIINSTFNKMVWPIKAKGFRRFNTFKEKSVSCIIHMIVSNSLKHNFVVQRRMYDLKHWKKKLCYLKKCFVCEFDTVDCNNHHIYIRWKMLSNVNMIFCIPTGSVFFTFTHFYSLRHISINVHLKPYENVLSSLKDKWYWPVHI